MIIREEGGVVVATIDPEQCAKLWAALEPYIQAGRRGYVFDLGGIDYLNSVGVAGLISTRNKVLALSGRVALANLSGSLQSIFRILRLERLFELGHDRPQAMKAVLE